MTQTLLTISRIGIVIVYIATTTYIFMNWPDRMP